MANIANDPTNENIDAAIKLLEKDLKFTAIPIRNEIE